MKIDSDKLQITLIDKNTYELLVFVLHFHYEESLIAYYIIIINIQ